MKFIIAFTSLVLVAGCAENKHVSPKEFVQSVVNQHLDSSHYHEWSDSENTPEKVFALIEEQAKEKNSELETCQALLFLEEKKLALFYDALVESNYGNNLPCQPELISRVDQFRSQGILNISRKRQLASKTNPAPVVKTSESFGPSRVVEVSSTDGPRWTRGNLPDRELLFTFDDGPHKERTPRLLRALAKENVQANFFMVGRMVEANPRISQDIYDFGHTVGNHSLNHKFFRKFSSAVGLEEISEGFVRLFNAIGEENVSPFFRFPYGGHTTATRAYLKENHISEFFWNIDTMDWKLTDPLELYEYALRQIEQARGGIILMHDIQEQTILVMPHLLNELKMRGYKPVVFRPKY